jgi:hypothetical protein
VKTPSGPKGYKKNWPQKAQKGQKWTSEAACRRLAAWYAITYLIRVMTVMKTGILIILGCIAALNLIQASAEIPWRQLGTDALKILRDEGTDNASTTDRQYQVIRQALIDNGSPARIGFITDARPGSDFDAYYYFAQYALVPVIVEPTPAAHVFVVGYFRSPESDIHQIPDFEPICIAGGGHVLFRRRTH